MPLPPLSRTIVSRTISSAPSALCRMPASTMSQITQFSIRTRAACSRSTPLSPPCPLIDRPRKVTLIPGASMVTPSPLGTVMPA